jgi:hypothetical protein
MYDNLPRRKIVSSPFPRKEIISHGIVGICKNTNRWLMVKPRFTTSFKYIIFGAYRRVYLLELLQNMTKLEIKKIKSVVSTSDIRYYGDIYANVTGLNTEFLYGYYRLLESKDDIMGYDLSDNIREPPYEFPKGKSEPGENSISVAVREFSEEIGYKLCGNIHPSSIEHHVKGIAGRNYKMKCWLCEISLEMNLKDANESKNVEIEHRAWVDAKNANMAERFPVVLSAENEKINITSETLELMTKSIKIINGSPSNFEVLNEK